MTPRGFDRFMIHVHLGSNLKMRRFNDAEFRCVITGVWALAAKTRPRGCLTVGGMPATTRDIADQAGCSVAVAKRTVAKMIQLGMLEYDHDHDWYSVHDWADINPAPKKDATNAERQARHRALRNAESNARNAKSNAPSNGTVTPLKLKGK